MAGISSMGDLAHEIETLIGQIELGLVPHGDGARQAVLQAGLDELARMRDVVVQGRNPPPSRDLLAALHAMGRGGSGFETPASDETVMQPMLPPAAVAALAADPDGDAQEAVGESTVETRVAVRAGSGSRQCGAAAGGAAARAASGATGPRARTAVRSPRDGARRRGTARPASEPVGRSQHRPGSPRAAGFVDRPQSRRAVAHGHSPEGTAAQSRDRDREADPASLREPNSRAAATSIRWNSIGIRRSSSCRAHWRRRPATWPASSSCSRA